MKKCLVLFFVGFLISGCLGGSQPSRPVKHYTLEYPVPRFENVSRINNAIRVERFTAARAFNGNEMVYRSKPYMRESYQFHRWNVTPVCMVTDLILRDMKGSQIFEFVLSREDAGGARFLLEGHIEEFMEIDEGEQSRSSMVVRVTLSDLMQETASSRAILQKSYKLSEPFKKDRQPYEMAVAMSVAMERFSKELILDVYSVAKESL
jgi:cholesterol transport system auxiliary component